MLKIGEVSLKNRIIAAPLTMYYGGCNIMRYFHYILKP
jgi:2,4-dienoyl-CoA reductase-like NADH-dependent reductase (Old Yellow Enzyme family)